jgi:iron complex transport system ATP-binding protein
MLYRLSNVSFAYNGVPALKDLDLDLRSGSFYGVLGPNGSGKTTFLDLLAGHRVPDRGSIRFKGKDLGSYRKKDLAREIGLVPQDFTLSFPFRVEEIVLMGRYPHLPRFAAPNQWDRAIVRRALEQTGTELFCDRYITDLSGGEKQRVIFARALAQQTPVLLLDEATSNLDVKFSLQLLQLARRLNRRDGVTVISVFHDVNKAAGFCDELLFFKQGELVCNGPTEEVLSGETLQQVFEVPAKTFFEPYVNALQAVFQMSAAASCAHLEH